MDNIALQRIRDLLGQHESIGIAVGSNPSVDDMAGALSLYLALSSMRKKATIASPTLPIVELSSLVGIDKVKTQFEGGTGGDLVVSFPYTEGEIEKVSYTIENSYLNIVVKAGEQGISFQDQDVRYTRGGGGGAVKVLFVVGTARLSDLGPLFDPDALKETTVVNIDNKSENQGFGDVVLVSPKASSVSEIVATLLTSLGITIDVDIAQNLLSGLSFATDNFQNGKTNFTTFELAATFMKQGAVRSMTANGRPQPQERPQVSPFTSPQPQSQPQSQPQMPPMPSSMPSSMPQQFPSMPSMPTAQSMPQPDAGMPSPMQSTPPIPQMRPKMPQNFPQPPRQNPGMPPMPPSMPQQQPQPSVPQQPRDNRKPPADWLTPKVYKGSTNLE